MKKTKIILGAAVGAFVVIALVIIGVLAYGGWEMKELEKSILLIYSDFENEQNRDGKISVLNNFMDDSENYFKYDKIENLYNETVSNMKNYFVFEYDKKINNYSSLLENDLSEDELNQYINELNEFLTSITSEKNIISENELNNSTNKINELINSFNDKLEKLKEEQKRAEEEAKAKAEAEADKKLNKDQTANNNQNGNSNSSNSNPANWRNPNTLKHSWQVDPITGEKIEGTDNWTDELGNVYDSNGYYLGFNIWDFNW